MVNWHDDTPVERLSVNWSNLEEVCALPPDWVAEHVNHAEARRICELPEFNPPVGTSLEAGSKTPILWDAPVGTWKADRMCEYWVRLELPIDSFMPSEGDWQVALLYGSTNTYIKWLREGFAPPPLEVVQHISGKLVTFNRRRWLAAKQVGLKTLPVWFSATDTRRCSRSKWWLPERDGYHIDNYLGLVHKGWNNSQILSALGSYTYDRIMRTTYVCKS